MDLEDFIVSNLLLPGGSLIYVLFCVTRYGWGWGNFVKEANKGEGLKVANWMRTYMTFVVPVIILIILIMGLIQVIDQFQCFDKNKFKNEMKIPPKVFVSESAFEGFYFGVTVVKFEIFKMQNQRMAFTISVVVLGLFIEYK